jgi:hypothetical protein
MLSFRVPYTNIIPQSDFATAVESAKECSLIWAVKLDRLFLNRAYNACIVATGRTWRDTVREVAAKQTGASSWVD